MTAVIEPDVDAYGNKTRHEALADLLEVWAFQKGRSLSKDELADYLKDREWLRRNFDLYETDSEHTTADDLGSQSDRSSEIAEAVFDRLRARFLTLKDRYPFELVRGRLQKRNPLSEANRRYVALLAISFFHGHKHEAQSLTMTESTERIVEACLTAKGLRVARTSAHGDDQQGFAASLATLGESLRLTTNPHGATTSKKARDAGVDVVGRLDFGDDQPGQWVFIGQVTCSKSGEWERKAREPAPSRWRGLLGLRSNPARFFAVPHEIPTGYREVLCQGANENLFILDRHRLVQPERPLLDDENQLIELFENVTVECPM